MPICARCGLLTTGSFCGQCGAPLSALPSPAAYVPPTVISTGAPVSRTRKTSPIVWVLVIVLGLVVLGAVCLAGLGFFVIHKAQEAVSQGVGHHNPAAAMARMLALVNPDIQVVSEDDSTGTVAVRDRKTGRIMTWNADQAKQGSFSLGVEDGNGKSTKMAFGGDQTEKLPSWVPSYPGVKARQIFAVTNNGTEERNLLFTTSGTSDKLLSFYRDEIKNRGMKVESDTSTASGEKISATGDFGKHSLDVAVTPVSRGQTMVIVTYKTKP